MTGTPVNRAEAPDRRAMPAGGAAQDSPSLLEAVEAFQLEGAFLLRGEFTEPWCSHSGGGPLLGPGRRVTSFHVVAEGTCWTSLSPDGERHWADRGDVIVVPYATPHFIGGVAPAEPVGLLHLVEP